MKVWVIGARGMLGSVLVEKYQKSGVDIVGSSHEEADVRDVGQLLAKVKEIQPTLIVNCAAYTDVDGAEKEPEAAFAVNALGAENAAIAAKACGARLIHISTDYVFNGEGKTPFREEDLCAPINQYGKSKLEGEERVLKVLPEACIVRTSWLFGMQGKNFISSLIGWMQQKEELQVACDQFGRPTYCHDLADAIIALPEVSGIIHFAGGMQRSRFQMAIDLLNLCKELGISLKCRRIIPVSSSAFPTPAPRPFYSVLDTEKYTELTQKKPRPWSEAIKEYIHAAIPSS